MKQHVQDHTIYKGHSNSGTKVYQTPRSSFSTSCPKKNIFILIPLCPVVYFM